jgi:hypothetical protein
MPSVLSVSRNSGSSAVTYVTSGTALRTPGGRPKVVAQGCDGGRGDARRLGWSGRQRRHRRGRGGCGGRWAAAGRLGGMRCAPLWSGAHRLWRALARAPFSRLRRQGRRDAGRSSVAGCRPRRTLAGGAIIPRSRGHPTRPSAAPASTGVRTWQRGSRSASKWPSPSCAR